MVVQEPCGIGQQPGRGVHLFIGGQIRAETLRLARRQIGFLQRAVKLGADRAEGLSIKAGEAVAQLLGVFIEGIAPKAVFAHCGDFHASALHAFDQVLIAKLHVFAVGVDLFQHHRVGLSVVFAAEDIRLRLVEMLVNHTPIAGHGGVGAHHEPAGDRISDMRVDIPDQLGRDLNAVGIAQHLQREGKHVVQRLIAEGDLIFGEELARRVGLQRHGPAAEGDLLRDRAQLAEHQAGGLGFPLI